MFLHLVRRGVSDTASRRLAFIHSLGAIAQKNRAQRCVHIPTNVEPLYGVIPMFRMAFDDKCTKPFLFLDG